jgi:hypothetical protein
LGLGWSEGEEDAMRLVGFVFVWSAGVGIRNALLLFHNKIIDATYVFIILEFDKELQARRIKNILLSLKLMA